MIRELTKEEFYQLYNTTYVNDFPENELKPYEMILSDWENNRAIELGYFENDVLTGYASVLFCGNNSLMLDYYGIVDPYKGQGKGTAFLAELKEYLQDYKVMFIEAEVPKDEQSTRRINFYKRCGAEISTVNGYLYFVDYNILIMNLSGRIPKEDQMQAIQDAYTILYPPEFRKQYLNLYLNKND